MTKLVDLNMESQIRQDLIWKSEDRVEGVQS